MRRRTLIILTASLALTPVFTASAQLGGKLRKLGSEIARDAAGIPDTKPAAGNDVAITSDRLDAVIAVLMPHAERARMELEGNAAEKEFNAWSNTFTPCVESAIRSGSTPSMEGLEASAAISEKSTALMERLSKQLTANNQRAAAYLQDTLRVLSSEQMLAMYKVTKCGKPRYAPPQMIEAQLARNTSNSSVGEDGRNSWDISVPENKRAGMSHYQFGMVRERLALYSMIKSGAIAPDKGGKHGVFSNDERGALDARAADISRLAPLFAEGGLNWRTWGDVRRW